MLLIAGLGNPGTRYEHNRHNVGFLVADGIAERHGLLPWRAKFDGFVAEGAIDRVRVILLKPQTFMNRSGRSVAAAAQFFKLPPADVIVLHDELDLAPFKVRVKLGGGHAGHNGLRDIDAHIGPQFRRVRIGVGHPGSKDRVLGHVLNDFGAAERPALQQLIDAIAEAIPLLVRGDDPGFMTRVALLTQPPPESKPKKESTAETDSGT